MRLRSPRLDPNFFYNRIPVTAGCLLVFYGLFSLRWWGLRRHFDGFLTPRGLSSICVALVGVEFTVYFGSVVALYFWYMDYHSVNQITLGCRVTLTIMLWTVKLAFVIMFYENRNCLKPATRLLLYTTTMVISVSFGVVIGLWVRSPGVTLGWYIMSATDGSERVQDLTVTILNPRRNPIESVTIGLNIGTDFLLVILAGSIVVPLRIHFRTIWLLATISLVTISTTIIRLVLLLHFMDMKYTYWPDPVLAIVVEYMTELEAFFAAFVSCLPGLRVLIRERSARNGNAGEFGLQLVNRSGVV